VIRGRGRRRILCAGITAREDDGDPPASNNLVTIAATFA
jgi:hypothetical protein